MADIVERIVFEEDLSGITNSIAALKDLGNTSEKELSKASTAIDEANKASEELADAMQETAKETTTANKTVGTFSQTITKGRQAITDYVRGIRVFGVSLGQLADGYKKAASGSTLLGKGAQSAAGGITRARIAAIALRTALGFIGVAIALVVAVLTAMGAAFNRSQKAVDFFARKMAQVRAVVDVFLDRAALLVEAVGSFFGGDKVAAAEKYRQAISGIGDELQREIRLAEELERLNQRIVREQINLDARRAAGNTRLKELNLLIEDVTKSDRVRIDAANEFLAIEENLVAKEVELAELELARLLGTTEATDELRAKLEEFGRVGFVFEELGGNVNELSLTLDNLGLSLSGIGDAQDFVTAFERLQSAQQASLEKQVTAQNKLNAIEQQRRERARKAAEERRKLEDEVQKAIEETQNKLQDLQDSGLEGEARIEADRRRALAEIDNLEEVTRAKFAEAKKQFNLDSEFAQLREETNKQADRAIIQARFDLNAELIQAEQDRQLAEVDLLTISGDEKLRLEEFQAQERARIQREGLQRLRSQALQEFGADSLEVLQLDVAIQQQENAIVEVTRTASDRRREILLQEADDIKAIKQAEADLIQRSGEEELTTQEFVQREKLKAELEFLKKKQAILAQDPNSTEAQKRLLDIQIQQIEGAIQQIGNLDTNPLERLKRKLADALNIDIEVLNALISNIGGIFNNLAAGISANIDRQISDYDRLISALDNRISETQSLLDEQLALREQGLANDSQIFQAKLAEDNRLRSEALAEKERLEKKAARQQLIIEAAQQASALSLAAAQLIAAKASAGLIGVVLAAGALAAAFSLFSRYKAAASAASNQIPQFREGGLLENGLVVGDSHERGGVKFVNRKNQAFELEGSEMVVRKDKTKKYQSALFAINSGKMDRMTPSEALAALGKQRTNERLASGARLTANQAFRQQGLTYMDIYNANKAANGVVVGAIEGRAIEAVDANGNRTISTQSGRKRKRLTVRKL